ncbi:hypothetical protein LUZ63_012506 [Rhynchospora breviuscula]|uniref:NAC domain-containing protein n=1 Tax=Rhynchospora breviuscula TaxID=2022672 RepID=A0A9Q0CL36_9POAL|nr:hypothetical protein LUZ63_012506 [Rhynchospora breviuscula]
MEEEYCSVPPGFRFHPTEEELVGYYLMRKVTSQKIDFDIIRDVDLYRIEPWDLQERCKHGHEEQSEWYFFSYKDRKYLSGTRTNRATTAGFWKATGRDKPVVSNSRVIGMRKTLVFYKGRAPNGRKTDWIMHEFRLQSSEHAPPQEEGWVVCRAFRKPTPNQRPYFNNFNPYYYNQANFSRPCNSMLSYQGSESLGESLNCTKQLQKKQNFLDQYTEMPQLDSPSLSIGFDGMMTTSIGEEQSSQRIDWKFIDSLLTSNSDELGLSSSAPVVSLD